jgi:lipopolysaccharide/colanic/teichoic acid biosynthesis glycosyltransferase
MPLSNQDTVVDFTSDTAIIQIPRDEQTYLLGKAILDFVFGSLLLVLSAPVILLAAMLVKLTSRGPAFYSQVRLGKDKRPFFMWKLRSMYHDCEKLTGPQWSTSGDPRVTPIGRFLRRSHIDELPQLWNVLKGDMSLVGPRPERPEFVIQLEQVIPHYLERLQVPPGITGLAQIQLPPDTDLESVRRKTACDLIYVKRVSFWLDLRILLCTPLHLLGIPVAMACRWFSLPTKDRLRVIGQLCESLDRSWLSAAETGHAQAETSV